MQPAGASQNVRHLKHSTLWLLVFRFPRSFQLKSTVGSCIKAHEMDISPRKIRRDGTYDTLILFDAERLTKQSVSRRRGRGLMFKGFIWHQRFDTAGPPSKMCPKSIFYQTTIAALPTLTTHLLETNHSLIRNDFAVVRLLAIIVLFWEYV
jgi:hypothetical protein